jgi:Domain of unknown function (DUF6468)
VIVGFNLGMLVEGSVTILLAVTIGYCAILNQRLKRLHSDRETLAKMVGDLVHATGLANSAVTELKTAALEADAKLNDRLEQAEKFEIELSAQVANGAQLIEKIARITAAARAQPLPEVPAPKAEQAKPALALESQSKLHSALQQLAMRPGIGGKAA